MGGPLGTSSTGAPGATPAFTARPLSATEFRARVIPALAEREAENNLLIGIAGRIAAQPGSVPDAVLLGVEADGAIVGAAGHTPPHDVVVTRLPAGAAPVVADYFAGLPLRVTGVSGPDDAGRELAESLAQRLGTAVRLRTRQCIYTLRAVRDVPRAAGLARRALASDHELISRWYTAFVREVNLAHPTEAERWARAAIASGGAWLWEDGGARTLACFARETPHGRAIGPVYTPPEARRQGYATSLVAELSRQTLAEGKAFACLFTDAANPTSNHIYTTIGFELICSFDAHALPL
jgi:uncharacterized protein